MKVFVSAAAFYTPGIDNWEVLQDIIAGNTALVGDAVDTKYVPETLPRNERRRASAQTRLSFRLAEAVLAQCANDFTNVSSVFASSGGDYDISHAISSQLALGEKQISPTEFHNSVHNAAGGYWGIATKSHHSSSSLSAYNDTFQASLVESALICTADHRPVLLVVADLPPPLPLRGKRPVTRAMGIAFLQQPECNNRSRFQIEISLTSVTVDTAISCKALQPLLVENSLARALPLLEAMHQETPTTVRMAGEPGIEITITTLT